MTKNPPKMKFTNVISRIFQNRFQQICIIISVSGDINVVKTRQIVASISMTSQFHKFSDVIFGGFFCYLEPDLAWKDDFRNWKLPQTPVLDVFEIVEC